MALQFILGSSRSGKTDFIYEQMIKDSLYKDIHAMEHLILMWWDFLD